MIRAARAGIYLSVPVVVVLLSQVHGSRLAPTPYEFVRTGRVAWASAFIVLMVAGCYVAGLPDSVRSFRSALVQAIAAVGVGALGISAVQLLVGDALLPRFVVFGSAAVLVPTIAALATIHRVGRDRSPPGDRVYFIGAEAERVRLQDELAGEPERPASLVGWSPPVDGRSNPAEAVHDDIISLQPTLIVLDLQAQASPTTVGVVASVHELGTRVRTLSLFYEEWLGKLPVSELERVALLFDVGELHRARYARVKRIADSVLATLGLVALALVVPVVWVGNLVGNRGPLLFRQERVGKGGEVFTMLKFRTMVPHSDAESWTQTSDARVTTFGRLLRVTHVDELPQMVNILRGELSLVGPRPEQVHYVEELSQKLPFYRLRHLVRPGLTGWAQVKYGYASDERDALEKLQYEFYYLRRQGLAFDARILARTARHLAAGGGR